MRMMSKEAHTCFDRQQSSKSPPLALNWRIRQERIVPNPELSTKRSLLCSAARALPVQRWAHKDVKNDKRS